MKKRVYFLKSSINGFGQGFDEVINLEPANLRGGFPNYLFFSNGKDSVYIEKTRDNYSVKTHDEDLNRILNCLGENWDLVNNIFVNKNDVGAISIVNVKTDYLVFYLEKPKRESKDKFCADAISIIDVYFAARDEENRYQDYDYDCRCQMEERFEEE